jgi:hypothetical protein
MGRLFRRWLSYWHGKKDADYQYDFFRCAACGALVTWNMIHKGGCQCGSARVSPTRPRRSERFRLLLLPWTV